jgi:[ribosomal protein S5]-alanine N-acetyltransferase
VGPAVTHAPDLTRVGAPDGRRGELQISVWSEDDVDEMGAYWARNREHLLPTQPHRDPDFWTSAGQRQRVERASQDVAMGRLVPFLVREDGRLVAEIMLSDVARGAFCSANLGYSVDGRRLRLGIASWAVAAVVDIAFSDLGLHRLQAGTMVDNFASQKVLERCEFVRIGVAARYLAIAGSWQDHVLWQRTNPDMPPQAAA